MKLFEFNGDWEFEYQFDAFKGLQSRRGSYTSKSTEDESDGTVRVNILDELNNETEPTEEQINAINYIIKNPQKIRRTLFTALENEYPKLKEMYDYDIEDEDSKEWFPDVESLEEFKNVFGVANMFVMLPKKEKSAYIGLECGCTWDDEHGLGFLLHENRLIKIGSADEAFSSWEAYKDNGTYEKEKEEWNKLNLEKKQLPKPEFYKPNSKYNKLKPSQVEANRMYENHLIERGYNQEFIDLVESEIIDININKGLSMTFLERAAQFNNLEIVKFILSKKPSSTKNVIHNAAGHCNKEIVQCLIENGIDINEPDHWDRTILKLTEERISQAEINENEWLNKYIEFSSWLKSNGAK